MVMSVQWLAIAPKWSNIHMKPNPYARLDKNRRKMRDLPLSRSFYHSNFSLFPSISLSFSPSISIDISLLAFPVAFIQFFRKEKLTQEIV